MQTSFLLVPRGVFGTVKTGTFVVPTLNHSDRGVPAHAALRPRPEHLKGARDHAAPGPIHGACHASCIGPTGNLPSVGLLAMALAGTLMPIGG